MRIATSTIYSQQATAIDNLSAQWQAQGQALSTGRSLNAPSDDPTQISTDLTVRSTITVENQQATNIQAATAQLTSTDSALANLTSIMQSARQLATRGASDLLSPTERQDVGLQVDQYLQQTVALANTQYGGSYIFAGSAQVSTPPLTTSGSPISSVAFAGNEQTAAPMLINGQSFTISPTLQQAFNYNATDGSPSVFQTLITLRDTLTKGIVTDQSATALNHAGQVIYGAGSPAPTTLAATTAGPFGTPPVPDNGTTPSYAISINSTDAAGLQHINAYTFTTATAVDNGTATSVVGQINANSATTGLSATFNAQTQRLTLTNAGGGAFNVTDEPSPGATKPSNFTQLFQLSGTATLAASVSTQLGDIDNGLNVVLNARAQVGTHINALATINTQITTDVLDYTSVQSGIEDTNVAKFSTAFSATQVALNASYTTTNRLEAKDLFDYI